MSHSLFEKHRTTLEAALAAIAARTYWSPFNEMPSPKSYGETAADDGKRAFESLLGKRFELDQPGQTGWHGGEISPYGIALEVQYPVCPPQALIDAGQKAMESWRDIGAEGRTGVCMEMLTRLNQHSFELAHSVMMTTGQAG